MKGSTKTAGSPNAAAASSLAAPMRAAQAAEVPHDAHAAPATARRGLDEHRQVTRRDRGRVQRGQHRHPGGRGQPLGLDLVAHRRDGLRGRADPGEARVHDGSREAGVLRQEAVPRMDGVRAGPQRRVDELVAAQVGVRGGAAWQPDRGVRFPHVRGIEIGIGAHGHGRQPQPVAGGHDTARDLAAVGDEHPGHAMIGHRRITSGRRRSRRKRAPLRGSWPRGHWR